jgi:hypothetical protein
MGIEPTYLAWKASVLPLNYTRINIGVTGFEPATSWSQTRRSSQAEPHPDVIHLCRSRDTRVIIYDVRKLVNIFFYFSQNNCSSPARAIRKTHIRYFSAAMQLFLLMKWHSTQKPHYEQAHVGSDLLTLAS